MPDCAKEYCAPVSNRHIEITATELKTEAVIRNVRHAALPTSAFWRRLVAEQWMQQIRASKNKGL